MTMKHRDPEKDSPKKKRSLLGRILSLALVACVVLGVAVLTTMEDGRHFAALRRWLIYGEGSGGSAGIYTYAPNPANRYALLGKELLVVSPNTAQLLRDDGTMLYDLSLQMTSPKLSAGRSLTAVCDVGGQAVYLLDNMGVQRTLEKAGELCFYSARLNDSDYLAVTEQKNGYKACVSVYDSQGQLVFEYDSYDYYVTDALVTGDNRRVVVFSLEPSGGVFSTRLRVFDLASAQQAEGSALIRDGLVMDAAVNGSRVLSLCDKRLVISTLDGERLLDQPYGNLYLQDYALEGRDFCALLLGRYQAGNVGTLTTYSLEGEEIASLELSEEVLDLSAAGNCLAVLYGERLVVYNRELEELARLEETGYAGQIRAQEDGSVLLLAGSSAWRFLP